MKSISIFGRYVWQCIFATLVVALTPLSYAFAQTVNPDLDGKIVYRVTNPSVQKKQQTQTFYSVDSDGSAVKNLFSTPINFKEPYMSADGSVVAYMTINLVNSPLKPQIKTQLWTMSGSGTNSEKLLNVHGNGLLPTLNAYGKKIAFCIQDSGEYEAYVANRDGRSLVKITFPPISTGRAMLNLQGDLVIVRSASSKWNRKESAWHSLNTLFIVTSDGKDGYQLIPTRDTAEEDYDDPAFSPDSQQIVFVSKNNEGNDTGTSNTPSPNQTSDICLVNKDGSNLIRLMHSKDIYKSPRFSPDGKYIVFNRKETKTSAKWQIWTMKVDGSDARCVVKGAENYYLVQWVGLPPELQKYHQAH